MSLLSDVDILRFLDREIVIHPFYPKSLTPVGYDFKIGEFVYSLENGILNPKNGFYEFPPKSTIQILTEESFMGIR